MLLRNLVIRPLFEQSLAYRTLFSGVTKKVKIGSYYCRQDRQLSDEHHFPTPNRLEKISLNSMAIKIGNHEIDIKSLEDDNSAIDGMELHQVVNVLKKLMPLEYAGEWDNVGLLIEPSGVMFVKNIMLTIDLTEKVLDEAISKEVNLIIAYHPPLFRPFKSLTQQTWKERIAIRCIENRIAVFSPHTAADAIQNGVNDLLLSPFDCESVKPIERIYLSPRQMDKLDYSVYFSEDNEEFLDEMKQHSCVYKESGNNYIASCTDERLPQILNLFQKYDRSFKTIFSVPKLPLLKEGMGRVAKLSCAITIKDAVESVKKLVGLSQIRLALSSIHTKETLVNTIAVCAGSGASILRKVSSDLIITGEMSHHEILDAVHSGSTLILCEHSNSEREYLKRLKPMIGQYIKLNISISELDSDPIKLV